MLEFRTEYVTERITRIHAFNTEQMYLVEGDERAALIDTGSGFGDLRACVARLTRKPLLVLLTHGHTDHAMGAGQFQKVYMNPADRAVFDVHGTPSFRWNSMTMSPERDAIGEKDYIPTADPTTFAPLMDGDVFDLGGVTLKLFACPGHTLGSMTVLIPEERLLLLGDACNGLTFLFDEFSTGVRTYRSSLTRLKNLTDGLYDGILISHDGGEPCVDMISGNLRNCDDILAGRTDDQPFVWSGKTYKLAKAFAFGKGRLDGGVGDIVFSDDTKERA